MVLALSLHHELAALEGVRAASDLSPYIATLPRNLASFPLLYTPHELDLLTGASEIAHDQAIEQFYYSR